MLGFIFSSGFSAQKLSQVSAIVYYYLQRLNIKKVTWAVYNIQSVPTFYDNLLRGEILGYFWPEHETCLCLNMLLLKKNIVILESKYTFLKIKLTCDF